MRLDELAIHPRTLSILQTISQDMPHALILEGPDGVGVKTIAAALAQSIGADLQVISPKRKVKTQVVVDEAEGRTIIDDVRVLYTQTRTKTSKRRVFVLDTGVKPMTHSAQNAFLKLLEEPTANTHFIIATHDINSILPTITSRSQTVSVLPVTSLQTSDYLKGLGAGDVPDHYAKLLFIGMGKPALIKRLIDNPKDFEARSKIMSHAKVLTSGSNYEALSLINTYKDNRSDALTLVSDTASMIKTILKKQPSPILTRKLNGLLACYEGIAEGGNVRLQLASVIYN